MGRRGPHTVHLVLLSLVFALARAAPAQPLARSVDMPLPGDTSRFDYVSFDPVRKRLAIAHLGASEVLVVDTAKDRVVARIAGISRVHGVLAVPERDRYYATATGTNELVAIDAASLAVVARVKVGAYPDGLAYAPDAGKLYVSNKDGRSESVVDAASHRVVATIPLGGSVGNSQYDPTSRRIYVNVQSLRQLVAIDLARDVVVDRIDLPGAEGNHGLLLLEQPHLALVACEDNGRLLVVDLARRTVTASFDVGPDPDVLAADAGAARVYVASESGAVDVFAIERAGVRALAHVAVAPGAHVVGVDPSTHRIFLPLADVGGRPVLRVYRPE